MSIEELLEEYKTLNHDDKIAFIHKVRRDNREKEQKELEEHLRRLEKKYVGRCYKWERGRGQGEVTTTYCRILDFRYEGNQWQPEAITFPKEPRFHFKKRLHLMSEVGDNFFGSTNFEGIEVRPILLFKMPFSKEEISDNIEEISEEEFNDAMRNFTEELIKDGGARSVSTSWLD